MYLLVRSALDPEALTAAVRAVVCEIDPRQAVVQVALSKLVRLATAQRRFALLLVERLLPARSF